MPRRDFCILRDTGVSMIPREDLGGLGRVICEPVVLQRPYGEGGALKSVCLLTDSAVWLCTLSLCFRT